jgi:hypothetical protein
MAGGLKWSLLLATFISPSNVLGDWSLVLEEEFEGDSLNSSLWKPRNNASHCCPQEPQLYLSNNIDVANGVLTITTREETVIGMALILCKHSLLSNLTFMLLLF